MKAGIYPGSFDPITKGHLDLIERSAALVDHLIVGVLINPAKSNSFFSIKERLELIEKAIGHLKNVEVVSFEGLLVDYVKERNINVIIRGVRGLSDMENEMQMAQINKTLLPSVETIFLQAAPAYSAVSSSAVRELAFFGGRYESFVPQCVAEAIRMKDKG